MFTEQNDFKNKYFYYTGACEEWDKFTTICNKLDMKLTNQRPIASIAGGDEGEHVVAKYVIYLGGGIFDWEYTLPDVYKSFNAITDKDLEDQAPEQPAHKSEIIKALAKKLGVDVVEVPLSKCDVEQIQEKYYSNYDITPVKDLALADQQSKFIKRANEMGGDVMFKHAGGVCIVDQIGECYTVPDIECGNVLLDALDVVNKYADAE